MNLLNYRIGKLERQPLRVRVPIFLSLLLLLWIPLALPIYRFVRDPNWVSILTMGILYVEFVGLVKFWGRCVYRQHLFRRYGLVLDRNNYRDVLLGLSIGFISLLTLVSVEVALGWVAWQSVKPDFIRIVLEGLAVALGLGFAEELLFRGWLLDELQRDYSPSVATRVNAFLFAIVHFIKPMSEIVRTLPAFPGLFLLGLTLVWAKKTAKERLGLAIGLHGGLVWGYYLINVGQLISYKNNIPAWVTGIDANPLAGLMGMVWLSAIAFGMRLAAKRQCNHPHPHITNNQ